MRSFSLPIKTHLFRVRYPKTILGNRNKETSDYDYVGFRIFLIYGHSFCPPRTIAKKTKVKYNKDQELHLSTYTLDGFVLIYLFTALL